MNAWQRSLEFFKVALKLAWAHKRLMLLPLASAGLTLVLSEALYDRTSFGMTLGGSVNDVLYSINGSDNPRAWLPADPRFHLGLEIFAFLVLPFITLFFNTAMIHSALTILHGRACPPGEGFSAALAKLPKILLWAVASGLLLWAFERRLDFSGMSGNVHMTLVIVGPVRALWNIASYFVIPILIFEGIELRTCLRRSLQLVAGTWKELVLFKFIFLAAILGVFGLLAAFFYLLGLGLGDMMPLKEQLLILPIVLVAVVLGGIETTFAAVLYSYAITGMSPAEFAGDLTPPKALGAQ